MKSPWMLLWGLGIAFVSLGLNGCGNAKYVPVSGKLLFEDGSPATGLEGRQVIFERVAGDSAPAADGQSTGTIDAQGNFTMGTAQLNDGVPPGMQRVMISEPVVTGDVNPVPVIDPKYTKFETSGLQYEAKAGGPPAEFKLNRAK